MNLELCDFAMTRRDLDFVLDILQENAVSEAKVNWYAVVGFLELNRVAVAFYNRAKKLGVRLPSAIKRKLNQSLSLSRNRNQIMAEWIQEVGDKMRDANISHAFLKGSILSNGAFLRARKYSASEETITKIYRDGERTSNDIDILLDQKEITAVSGILRDLGFRQGYWNFDSNRFVELSRAEILSRRMNRGETAPFIKVLDGGILPFVEVDINFSLDHLPGGDRVSEFLRSAKQYGGGVYGLDETMFFIHLILHQYKEATVFSMVQRGKDAELYKYLDLYFMIHKEVVNFDSLYDAVRKMNLERECYFTLFYTAEIFRNLKNNESFMKFLESIKPNNPAYIDEVYDPENKGKAYRWHAPVLDRLTAFEHLCYLSEKQSESVRVADGEESVPSPAYGKEIWHSMISKFTKVE